MMYVAEERGSGHAMNTISSIAQKVVYPFVSMEIAGKNVSSTCA